MRIVKEAEERRNEILDAAERLFSGKGYNHTTINHILDEVQIAKGTFYYYFKSKEEVMDAIIDRVNARDVQAAELIVRDKSLTPVEKIYQILAGQQPKGGDFKDMMIRQFNSPSNAEMQQKSIALSIKALSPILAIAVQEGIDQGIFHTGYPQEAMEILLVSGQILFDPVMFHWTEEESQRKIMAFIAAAETLLGAEQGSFEFVGRILAAGGQENGCRHGE